MHRASGRRCKTGDIVLKAGTRIGSGAGGNVGSAWRGAGAGFKPWKVAVLSTGDELVRIDQVPDRGRCGILIHGRCPVM